MVTQEKLKEYIAKAKSNLTTTIRNSGDNKYDPDIRGLRKKFKRLSRKNTKIKYAEKKAAEKGKKKNAEK